MFSYRTIVVGTDGSDTSLKAVRHAASLARVYDAALIVVSAYHGDSGSLLISSPTSDTSTLPVVSEGRAAEYLDEARRVAEEEGAPTIELQHRDGAPVNELIAAVEENEADLLVVGNKGVNSLAGRLFGNIPTETARRSDVDVVLVHTE
ncbi:universal stress protein [Corynebacterium maris DSM 45190]|uniref:Universal stress protein n=1 Tax=Corynebacterium maris DSM 45190 TaxID=1224163 RepID=S5SUK8_9CORY|nr:universal stress protein [Corynebacterium maris]AGS34737.1 universal stress protein [Corynebacterium maris DSM 45190]MDO5453359.1 universal stress protein [Corynebacterium sp.]